MANSQGAAGPAKQTRHTMPAEDTMTSKEKWYVSPDTNNLKSFSEWLGPEEYDVTNGWVNVDIYTMETHVYSTQEKANSCSKYIHSDSDLHQRPSIKNKAELRDMYQECFSGVGKFKDFEYHINIDKNVRPVVHAPCKIALLLQNKVEKETEGMVKQGIIAPVEGHSDWVNSFVITEKPNGRLRVCLDPKDINKAIKREHHPIPTLDDITPRLHGCTLFSKLDVLHGYWNIKLDEELALLITFNTCKGRYKFLRMPFGLKMSQDIFQKINQTYEKCKGTIGIADDIQVFHIENTHDLHLHETMKRTCKY